MGFHIAALGDNVFVFAAVNLSRSETIHKRHGFGHPLLEVGKTHFVVFVSRYIHPRQPGHHAFGCVASNLNLTRHGKHIGVKPKLRQSSFVPFFAFNMYQCLVQQMI